MIGPPTLNEFLGYNYTQVVSSSVRREGGWKFIPATAPQVTKLAVIPTETTRPYVGQREVVQLSTGGRFAKATLVCGWCNYPAYLHPGTSNERFGACDRIESDFPMLSMEATFDSPSDLEVVVPVVDGELIQPLRVKKFSSVALADYYLWPTGDYTLFIEDSFDDDEQAELYVSPAAEIEAVENWQDDDPCAKVHPHKGPCELKHKPMALDRWYVTPSVIAHGPYPQGHEATLPANYVVVPKKRTTFIEGEAGYVSKQLLDLTITKRFQNTVVNCFVDKDGFLRVGGVRLALDATHVTATCVGWHTTGAGETPRKCNAQFTELLDQPRERMEEIAWAIIAHGNNHAAKWFRERDTYYDVNLLQEQAIKLPKYLDSKEAMLFLFEHQVYCQSRSCNCDSWVLSLAALHLASAKRLVTV